MIHLTRLALCVVAACFSLTAFAGPAPDNDGDTVPDVLDNCSGKANAGALSCDTDMDGYGNTCDHDYDNDGDTDSLDFGLEFLPDFNSGATDSQTDSDCDGDTDSLDFGLGFLPDFNAGAAPGPSGLPCAGTVPCK